MIGDKHASLLCWIGALYLGASNVTPAMACYSSPAITSYKYFILIDLLTFNICFLLLMSTLINRTFTTICSLQEVDAFNVDEQNVEVTIATRQELTGLITWYDLCFDNNSIISTAPSEKVRLHCLKSVDEAIHKFML